MKYPKVADVAVFNTAYNFDTKFSYIIPERMVSKISVGNRVMVPFGRGNHYRQALVLDIFNNLETEHPLKEIKEILDDEPLFSKEMIKLLYWMKNRYFCSFYDAIKVMVPPGIQYNLSEFYRISEDFALKSSEISLSPKEVEIIEFLSKQKKPIKREKLLKVLGYDLKDEILANLISKNLLKSEYNFSQKTGNLELKLLQAEPNITEMSLPPRQKEVYDLICDSGCMSQKEIIYYTGVSSSVINSLIKKKLLKIVKDRQYRIPYSNAYDLDCAKTIKLTSEQQKAFDDIFQYYKSPQAEISLLYGITGSGKTSVFIKLIDEISAEGKGIIFMLPEISLTSQMINLFKSRYGDKVAVFHSALSMGERLDEYKRVKNGMANIVIGTRSAVFAPLDKIGIIIMDEEQEYSYKSDSSPRFNAKDIAKFRINEHKALLLLASATPSVESYYKAKKSIYHLNTLKKRYGKAKLPIVTIVDMNEENRSENAATFLSMSLINAIATRLERQEQSILLLNRRGYNTFVKCRTCKEVLTCPNCSISLTYHAANNRLMCHYCGYSLPFTTVCPNCHSESLIYAGVGTQRLEDDLKNFFPSAKVLRMDADNILRHTTYVDNFKAFKDGKYDIMIGTQMVAKGLDFPMVTLVGVLNADHSIYENDFRSYEKTFDLITQVVGRSGRHEKAGKAIIQTYSPENSIISLAAKQDYDSFYNSEINIRKSMIYPPFSDICVIIFKSEDKSKVLSSAKYFSEFLKKEVYNNYPSLPIRIFRISELNMLKLQSKYNYKLIMKVKNNDVFRKLILSAIKDISKNKNYKTVSIAVDINPGITTIG